MHALHQPSILVRSLFVALVAGGLLAAQTLSAEAQASRQGQQRPAQQKQAEPEETDIEQIALTQSQIDAFVATEQAIKPITAKIKGQPSKQVMGQLEAAAKKNGFKDFDEYGDVASNIGLVFGGIDPESKKYDPDGLIKREIAAVQGNAKIPAKQKQQILKDLQEAGKNVPKLEHPGNAELVARNYDKLRPLMGGHEGPGGGGAGGGGGGRR